MNPPVIDFHTHAFPDPVAAKAVPALEQAGNMKATSDGTIQGLLASMDSCGITASVICSIATRVNQFAAILQWSEKIRSKRIIPLPSLHPDDPDLVEHIHQISDQGFIGIKLHPYYQNFYLAENRLDRLYAALTDCNLLLVVHSGFDIAYPQTRRTDPEQVLLLLKKFPRLRLITTHLGGWQDWHEVERLLIGKPIHMEISFALNYLNRSQARKLLTSHPADYLLFGSDTPWVDQSTYLQQLQQLKLPPALYEKIVWKNGEKILQTS